MMRSTPNPIVQFGLFLLAFTSLAPPAAYSQDGSPPKRIAFVGLHGGVFDSIQELASAMPFEVAYVTDDAIREETVDFGAFQVVLLQHVRGEDRDQYARLLTSAKAANLGLRVLSISGLAERKLPALVKKQIVASDPQLKPYYGNTRENLRRLLLYIDVTYLNGSSRILPAEPVSPPGAVYHPQQNGLFSTPSEFIAWSAAQGRPTQNVPRVVVAVHSTHLTFQQPAVVNALIAALEQSGVLAAGMIDLGEAYEQNIAQFAPHLIIHTCHSRETVDFRKQIGIPHLHSIFFRGQSIQDWQTSANGLSPSELAFHIVGQELLGGIEPQVAAGTAHGGGGPNAFIPIDDRIDHLVARATAWINLARTSRRDKRIAMIYYDRELGKSELMRGSATGMFMNGPRSMVNLLQSMRDGGYQMTRVPTSEDELLGWLTEHGRQIGVWAPGELERIAAGGQAALVPVEEYTRWFEELVPEAQQAEVIEKWGPPPGKFMVLKRGGNEYIVLPKVDLGNIVLMPQPLRGEAHDTTLVHDLRVPPPHNYLATYFWLQKSFDAHAMVHFGTHGSEFMLPGKPTGLSAADWPDIVLGDIPNINPWVLNNLGESSPVKRRAYAVLIDHLVPPSVNAELSDELLNLHNDIDKWFVLGDGALREKFRAAITHQAKTENLLSEIGWDTKSNEPLPDAGIQRLLEYLHEIHNETTPVNLHVFGQPPRSDLLIPYLVTCLGSDLQKWMATIITVPAAEALTPGDSEKFLRAKAEELLGLVVRQQFTPRQAIEAITKTSNTANQPPLNPASDNQGQLFLRLQTLVDGFQNTGDELNHFLAALDGQFVPPGPGNSPDRNAAALPTGRNMVVMNPEEVPTRPSWELGCQLIDQMLAEKRESQDKIPEKVAFTLSSFATFQDYGIMESQILYLLGVRPVWDAKNVVTDVEIIPLEELGRPRVDVFIAGQTYYRDMLPTRMALIDKAVRRVAQLEEPAAQNWVRRNSQIAETHLIAQGKSPEDARALSQARIFGYPKAQFGSAGYYYLVERSGQWDTREDLMSAYLSHVRNVYTQGMWGEPAAEAYNQHIQGTEIVIRSWSDRTRSPSSNKYDWYKGGSLAMAVSYLTGKEPEFLLSDVRDANSAKMVSAENALHKDFRVRILNRKWIEGMMREGYAGADQVTVHVSNAMGWSIMRPGSVPDSTWQSMADIYVRDSKNLNIREWFDSENPHAYQEMLEVMLESIRKGYWNADQKTQELLARQYTSSVSRHGPSSGLRSGGNAELEMLVKSILLSQADPNASQLLASYTQQLDAASTQTATTPGLSALAAQAKSATPSVDPDTKPADSDDLQPVQGQRLSPADNLAEQIAEEKNEKLNPSTTRMWSAQTALWTLALVVGAAFLLGFLRRSGAGV